MRKQTTISTDDFKQLAYGDMTERQFQELIKQMANALNWKYFHDHDSRRNPAGFPDTCLVKEGVIHNGQVVQPGRCVFAELKTTKGRLRPEQERWLDALRTVPGVETYLWRPSDLPKINYLMANDRVRS